MRRGYLAHTAADANKNRPAPAANATSTSPWGAPKGCAAISSNATATPTIPQISGKCRRLYASRANRDCTAPRQGWKRVGICTAY